MPPAHVRMSPGWLGVTTAVAHRRGVVPRAKGAAQRGELIGAAAKATRDLHCVGMCGSDGQGVLYVEQSCATWSFCTAGSKAPRMFAVVRWMRSQEALTAATARSPPPAHVVTYPKE